ncbi:phage holin [Mycoplasmatota bacterium WC44]
MNFKVRFKNPIFWITLISQIIVVCKLVGIDLISLVPAIGNFEEIVNIIFMLLATLGIAVDPTTKGWLDSKQAMLYNEPKND